MCCSHLSVILCAKALFIVGATVGLERTFFRVSEDVGVVELCANVSFPVIDCPIAFPFDVQLSTFDGSAGTVSFLFTLCMFLTIFIILCRIS